MAMTFRTGCSLTLYALGHADGSLWDPPRLFTTQEGPTSRFSTKLFLFASLHQPAQTLFFTEATENTMVPESPIWLSVCARYIEERDF